MRAPLSPMPWIASVRVSVSGLYCSEITRSTEPLVGSTCTSPQRVSFGEPGKGLEVIYIVPRHFSASGSPPAVSTSGSGTPRPRTFAATALSENAAFSMRILGAVRVPST